MPALQPAFEKPGKPLGITCWVLLAEGTLCAVILGGVILGALIDRIIVHVTRELTVPGYTNLCHTTARLSHRRTSVTPPHLCHTTAPLSRHRTSVTRPHLCHTTAPLSHRRTSATPPHLCHTTAPLLHDRTFDPPGKISYAVTRVQPGNTMRYTSFIEMACPLFSMKSLTDFLDVLDPALTDFGMVHSNSNFTRIFEV